MRNAIIDQIHNEMKIDKLYNILYCLAVKYFKWCLSLFNFRTIRGAGP